MKVLVLAPHDGAAPDASLARVLAATGRLAAHADVLVTGYRCERVAGAVATIAGVGRVLLADDASLAANLPEATATLLARLAPNYDAVAAAADSCGKDVMPRAAALAGAPMVSEVTHIVGPDIYVRAMFAGNVTATVRCAARTRYFTVRTSAFTPSAGRTGDRAAIVAIDAPPAWTRTRLVAKAAGEPSGRFDLATAAVVIGAGRGAVGREIMASVARLAEILHAAIGVTRPVVDAGAARGEQLLGQSGGTVAPDLYLALGVSGALQHMAGVKDAKVIAAINSDSNAPIFAAADVGLVADLAAALPEFETALAELGRR